MCERESETEGEKVRKSESAGKEGEDMRFSWMACIFIERDKGDALFGSKLKITPDIHQISYDKYADRDR